MSYTEVRHWCTTHDTETYLQALRDMHQIPGWKPWSTPTSGKPVLQAVEHAQSVVNGIQEWAKKEAAGGALGKLPDPAADIAATLRQTMDSSLRLPVPWSMPSGNGRTIREAYRMT
ncbi:hypothetical protein GQ54DRAFT_100233 [Martensiomyces pterosporus]|nr:hypothetical protein GQ54DRAFT_100233 [Martensiomyces pterosporus]